MFSRFKKTDSDARPSLRPVSPAAPAGVAPAAAPAAAAPAPQPAPKSVLAARAASVPATPEAAAAEKEKKRKERLMELKVELHKKLLESLNLAALEQIGRAHV